MDIVMIGSGNVAQHLALAFKENNITVKQIFGRNKEALQTISSMTNIPFSTDNLDNADLYLISVSDDAIEEVSKLIDTTDALVAHTSGSQPIEILSGDYRKASFYPLQTFSKDKKIDYKNVPFFIETENSEDQIALEDLARKISDRVMEVNHEKRKYIHLTAVFACNFTNHLYARAKEIADEQDIPFSYFLPLIDETTEKIHFLDPKEAQTGPAIRNDQRVLELHRKLLEGEPLNIYDTMNESIKKMYDL